MLILVTFTPGGGGGGGGDFGNLYPLKINTSGTPNLLDICLQRFGDISILYHSASNKSLNDDIIYYDTNGMLYDRPPL